MGLKKKICLVGGGSYAWVDGLYANFLRNPFFDRDTELCLYDINPEALDDLFEYCRRGNERFPECAITLTKTTDEDAALEGASYVIIAISHGGTAAELHDHEIARKYGFYNVKGSESGIAGASRTVRHVPEFVRIARKMKRLCEKDAMIMNVTNPLTSLVRCVREYAGVEAAGFCHGIMNHLEILLPYIGADTFDDISFSVSGVDHCSFLIDVKYKGEDALEIMRKKGMIDAAWQGKTNITYDDPFAGRENQRIRFILWDILGTMPGLSDEHCAEFYYQVIGNRENRDFYGMHYDRIEERKRSVSGAKEKMKKWLAEGEGATPRYCEEIIDRVIEALEGGRKYHGVMNYKNVGQVREFPLDMVVETWVDVDAVGFHPNIALPLPKAPLSVSLSTGLREELFMEAAMEHDVKKLASALAIDPSVQDFRSVRKIAEEIFEYNDQFRRE
ncbi:MAG: hypothetical protein II797_02345 [Clostridia bacterium]|nr:hypothetical protein [Clostridia bacterium]